MKKQHAFILSFLITVLIASNVFILSNINSQQKTKSLIIRVIDGDTLVLEGGKIIRLTNINTPERNEPGYEKAKYFISNDINKKLQIRTEELVYTRIP